MTLHGNLNQKTPYPTLLYHLERVYLETYHLEDQRRGFNPYMPFARRYLAEKTTSKEYVKQLIFDFRESVVRDGLH